MTGLIDPAANHEVTVHGIGLDGNHLCGAPSGVGTSASSPGMPITCEPCEKISLPLRGRDNTSRPAVVYDEGPAVEIPLTNMFGPDGEPVEGRVWVAPAGTDQDPHTDEAWRPLRWLVGLDVAKDGSDDVVFAKGGVVRGTVTIPPWAEPDRSRVAPPCVPVTVQMEADRDELADRMTLDMRRLHVKLFEKIAAQGWMLDDTDAVTVAMVDGDPGSNTVMLRAEWTPKIWRPAPPEGEFVAVPRMGWVPAEPLPYLGWKARLEQRLRRWRFTTPLANLLALADEWGLGR